MTGFDAVRDTLRPTKLPSVYSILASLKYDLSDWANVKKRAPSQNPKYCYNWSFPNPNKSLAVCIWLDEVTDNGLTLIQANNLRYEPLGTNPQKVATWRRRARSTDKDLQNAYLNRLPLHAVILVGKRRDRFDPLSDSSSVGGRRLDEVTWAITEYDFETGDFVLMRGAKPVEPFAEAPDPDVASYKEGTERLAFRRHRHREWRARRDKIAAALKANGGRLVCEVPKCGFDFESKYGAIGKGFAHVHHLEPLGKASAKERETKLEDLAVVCPNCHAMIHVGGECRKLNAIIL